MQRILHGSTPPPLAEDTGGHLSPPPPHGEPANEGFFNLDYLFLDLQENVDALLPANPSTVQFLTDLGDTMRDQTATGLDSTLPSAYTYLGQFMDHDIIQEFPRIPLPDLSDPRLAPLSLDDARQKIGNRRVAPLDLDSVYAFPAPRDGMQMKVGPVTATGRRPPGVAAGDLHDLPRQPRSTTPQLDRAALIGDGRDDENLVVAQLHVAFLRAHNGLVQQGKTFDEARSLLIRHYHWIIIHDFLQRIAEPELVRRAVTAPRRYDGLATPFFLPLEFTAAAYRFGHSLVRGVYDYNSLHRQATLGQLFTLTALSGDLAPVPGTGFNTLPEDWIIEWEGFVEGRGLRNIARRIDTQLVEPLFSLRNEIGGPRPGDVRLAVRNLLRGYLMRIPTGQAVAAALGLPALSPREIESVAANPAQLQVLRDSGFSSRTPLWFYVLAEAAAGGGNRLGPVGSTLVAEVVVGLVRASPNSILSEPDWKPTMRQEGAGENERFGLPDLLRFAGVLP